MEKPTAITQNTLLGNNIQLLQFNSGHRAGTDAVLLAASVPMAGSIIDVSSSTGAVGLIASRLNKSRPVYFLEQDSELSHLCQQNIVLNSLTNAHVATASLFDKNALLEQGINPVSADIIATNPPFLDATQVQVSPHKQKAAAHVLAKVTLKDWLDSCARLLKPKGTLCLIHRAEKIGEIFRALHPFFGGMQIRFIHSKHCEPANRVVVRCIKDSKAPTCIEEPLIVHEPEGAFTPEAQALHDGTQISLFQRKSPGKP